MRWLPPIIALAGGAWAFLPTLGDLADKWRNDPQYSHGLLVPIFAGHLVYRRREIIQNLEAKPAGISGAALAALAIGCRIAAAFFDFLPLDGFALIAFLGAGVLLSRGTATFRVVLPALGFLLFALPLPYEVERWLSRDLQHLATLGGTFLLQTIGQPAINEGNVILIGDIRLGIVEACSGLRMLMTFAALATAIAMVIERTWVTKLLLILGAVPIALGVNILRIAATGEAHVLLVESPQRESMIAFIHDFNGWLMMPVALAAFLIELSILNWLLIEPDRPLPVISFPLPVREEPVRRAA